jgi:hypothetical protein
VVLRRGRRGSLGAGRQAAGDVDLGGKATLPARDLGQTNGEGGFQERLNKRQGWPLNGLLNRRGIQRRKKGQPRLKGRPSSAKA